MSPAGVLGVLGRTGSGKTTLARLLLRLYDYNVQRHWAHESREDGCHSPAEVLGGQTGTMYPPSVLDRILFATRYTRHLDRNGYLRFQNWKLYGERGLAKAPVTVWIYEGSLKVEHQAVTLAQYSVGLQDDRKHVQKVSNPRLVETPFRSPQLALFDLGPDEWLLYWRAPDYAPARRKRRVEGLVQPLLFDFPREEKAVGANKIGPLHHHAVTSMSFPHPLMTTRAARIAIPCCSTYRHGHEQLSSRRDE